VRYADVRPAHASGRPRYICHKDPAGRVAAGSSCSPDLAETEARDRILTVLEHSPSMLDRLLAKHRAQSAGDRPPSRPSRRAPGTRPSWPHDSRQDKP
jgi:hypothetical protein